MFFFIYLSILSSVVLYSCYFLKKNNILVSETGEPHQKFASNNKVPLLGGVYLFLSSIYFFETKLLFFYFFGLSILILGIFSDLKYLKSAKLRLFLQIFIVILFVYLIDIKIYDTRIFFLDYILQNVFINFIFVSFCVLILINGSNFFDGLNALNIGYYFIISIFIYYLNYNNLIYLNDFPLNYFILSIAIMLLLNILNKTFLGDSGSYILGLFFSIFSIFIYKWNPFISPFFIILLLWYPCFEILFSILRKNILKKSPMRPDSNHLHQLIFYYIKKRFVKNNILHANIISSVLINLYNFLIFMISINFISNSQVQIMLIILNVFCYFFIYLKLFLLRYKKI